MKTLIIFGSTSDGPVYEPLTEDMKKSFHAQSVVLSAHRNPHELRKLINEDKYDLYIAGAGLAAHLPGVIASLTTRPVIGLPVSAVFSGLDSLFSILQMPFGVPVLTFGPNRGNAIRPFLEHIQRVDQRKSIKIIIQKNKQHLNAATKEVERLKALGLELGRTLEINSHYDPLVPCINFVTKKEESLKEAVNVPILEKKDVSREDKALEIFSWAKNGAPWVGVNNSRNALLWWNKFLPR